MAHSHREGAIGTGVGRQPLVGELRVDGVVGTNGDDLLSAIPGFGHEVRVGGPGDRDVRTPHDEVGGVPPIRRLGNVSLVSEDLGGSNRQIGIPVVKRDHGATEQTRVARSSRVRGHRHGRNRREAGDAVRPPFLDRVHLSRGDHLKRLVPARPNQTSLAASRLIATPSLRITHQIGPRQHGITESPARLAIHL